MAKYRKKPIEIEAFQFADQSNLMPRHDGGEGFEVPMWFADAVLNGSVVAHPDYIEIHTLEGTMIAQEGDWIIRGLKGELYPCKPDIFEASYEAVEG